MADTSQGTGGLTFDKSKRSWPNEMNILLALFIIIAVFEAIGQIAPYMNGQSFLFDTKDRFDSIFNEARLQIIILQVAIIGIIALGVTQVIITAGIDLSSGPLVAATAMVAMSFGQTELVNGFANPKALFGPWAMDLPVIIPVVIGLTFGACIGLINGTFIAYFRIPPFIATLGMFLFCRGIWFVILAIIFQLIMSYTVYGKHTYAIGSNEEAARMSGINVKRHKLLVYMIASMLAAFAGIVLSSKAVTAQAGMGEFYELFAIAMAVIGGISLQGGRGSIIGTVLGAMVLGVIRSGFTYIKLDGSYQLMAMGAIIDIVLETKGLTKHYGGVQALNDANFVLRKGEHVAIMGDNGAGKSTFVRQITGVEQRTSGTVIFDGKEVNFAGPLDAREAGIETVFQTLALADDLNVPDNLFLGRERTKWNWLGPFRLLDYKGMRDDTMAGLVKTGVKIPNIKNAIANMSGGQRQCVAIARTATFASKLTIMDEPTAALGVQETAQVENIVRTLKEQGESLILVSHNMRQVFDGCIAAWRFTRADRKEGLGDWFSGGNT